MNMGIIASSRLRAAVGRVNLIGQDLGSADFKYLSLELANNGKLYAAPFDALQVLEIDPVAGTTTLIGQDLGGGTKYLSLALANNGKLYAAPGAASKVLEIDPVNQTTTFIGQDLGGGTKYYDLALANNGKLYAAPFNASQVLEINP